MTIDRISENKKVIFVLFLVVCIIQLGVIYLKIFQNNLALDTGTHVVFETVPADPFDPFRGRYITLRYSEEREKHEYTGKKPAPKKLYAVLSTDEKGVASISKITDTKPSNGLYMAVKRSYSPEKVRFIQNRYYMNEFDAYTADKLLNRGNRENVKVLVHFMILNSVAVIQKVTVNDIPIEQYIKEHNN